MAAYNFMKRFAPAVRSGKKRSTIRARRKNGYLPEKGACIDLYTGMRSKACRKLRRVKVRRVRPIVIATAIEPEHSQVVLDGVRLTQREVLELARADGFANTAEFFEYFETTHGSYAALYLIEW
jgi:hypothetical protein